MNIPKKKTNEEFISEVYNLVKDDYIFLEEYINAKTKILCKHNTKECGYQWKTSPNNFLSGIRCPKCFGTHKKTTKQIKQEIYDLVGDEYSLLSNYINAKTKIKLKHNSCGFEFKVLSRVFINRGQRCPDCAIKRIKEKLSKNTQEFKQELYQKYNNEFTVLGEYVNIDTHIELVHNVCGHRWEVVPYNILNKSYCPKCSKNVSKQERKIMKILEENKITYQKEYRINECRNILPLPFDFGIFANDKLFCLLEYDGRQHEFPVDHFGGQEKFKERIKNDQIKNEYCQNNNIKLIRISRKQKDSLEKILLNKVISKII